jgi:arylsulfatase A-like enzyme
MVNFLDDQLLNITNTFKQLNMWDNTLMILTSDNGGYVKNNNGGCNSSTGTAGSQSEDFGHGTGCFNGEAGANNWPLRGGKYSMFEGGIRVNAFASGGYLPINVRGTKLDGIIHIADWYGTLCGLAGVSPFDDEGAASGLPPVDSVDVWPMVSGTNMTSPRETILVNENLLVHNQWKYVPFNTKMIESERGGPIYPNMTSDQNNDWIDNHSYQCVEPNGCLWNIEVDVSEQHECSKDYPNVVTKMQNIMATEVKKIWKTSHQNAPNCNPIAYNKYGGFYGPFEEI